ncbi:MAG: hypothetical protein DVB31_03785 [Verrucomicrobia bacterium]|nr:MAG: hypothetical protein DVB31_03785 [Verrucomicrobiota bacterium]
MDAQTLGQPSRRNSFHPAWLLLPLPALARICVAAQPSGSPLNAAQVLQFVLALALVAPWVWWRSGTAPAPVLQWMKECRGLMPGFLIAMIGPACAALAADEAPALLWGFPIGCLLMGAGLFASEFENRTLATLLVQPRSRAAIYRRKHAVLAVLLGIAIANMVLSFLATDVQVATPRNFLGTCGIGAALGLLVLASAPLYALLTRTTIAAATFTVAIPLMAYAALTESVRFCRWLLDLPELPPDAEWSVVASTAWVYAVACAVLGWRTFARLDATDGAQANAGAGLVSLGRPAAWLARAFGTGPTGHLVRKELRLQSIPWVTALLMAGIALLAAGWRFTERPGNEKELPLLAAVVFMGMAAVVCLLGTGAACVAEERQIGTHDWQLTQPATLRRQWWVKLAVTVGVALLVGCVWPVLLVRVALGSGRFAKLLEGAPPGALAAYSGAALGLLALSILASSLSRTTLKAGVAAIGAAIAVGTFVAFAIDAFDRLTVGIRPGTVVFAATIIRTLYMIGVAVVLWLAALLEFARRNHRRSSVPSGSVVRNWLAVAATTALVTCIPYGNASLAVRRIAAAERAAALNQQWDQLEAAVRQGLANGTLPPGVREAAAAGAGMSPREIAAALLREHGDEAFRVVNPPPAPRTPSNPSLFRMDPILMKRYGLVPRPNPAPATEEAKPTPAQPPKP